MALIPADDFQASELDGPCNFTSKFTYRYGLHNKNLCKTWQLTSVDGYGVMTGTASDEQKDLGSDVINLPLENSWSRLGRNKRFKRFRTLHSKGFFPKRKVQSLNLDTFHSFNGKGKGKFGKLKYLRLSNFDKCKNKKCFVRSDWSDACQAESDSSGVSAEFVYKTPSQKAEENHTNFGNKRAAKSVSHSVCEITKLLRESCTNDFNLPLLTNTATKSSGYTTKPKRRTRRSVLYQSPQRPDTRHLKKVHLNGVFAYVSGTADIDQLMKARPIVILERIATDKTVVENLWRRERPHGNMSIVEPNQIIANMDDDIDELKQNISNHELGEFPLDLTKYSLGPQEKLIDVDTQMSVSMSKLQEACNVLTGGKEVPRNHVLHAYSSEQQQHNEEPEYIYYEDGSDSDMFAFDETFGISVNLNGVRNLTNSGDVTEVKSDIKQTQSKEAGELTQVTLANPNKTYISEQSNCSINTDMGGSDSKGQSEEVISREDVTQTRPHLPTEGPPDLDNCAVLKTINHDDDIPSSPPVVDEGDPENQDPDTCQVDILEHNQDHVKEQASKEGLGLPSVSGNKVGDGEKHNSRGENKPRLDTEDKVLPEAIDGSRKENSLSSRNSFQDSTILKQTDTEMAIGQSDSALELEESSHDCCNSLLPEHQMDVETDEPYPVSVVVVSVGNMQHSNTQTFSKDGQSMQPLNQEYGEPYDLSCDENRKDSFMGVAAIDESLLKEGITSFNFREAPSNLSQQEGLITAPELDAFEHMTIGLSDDEVFPRLVIAEEESNIDAPPDSQSGLVIESVVSLQNVDESFLGVKGYTDKDLDNLIKPETETIRDFILEEQNIVSPHNSQQNGAVNDIVRSENGVPDVDVMSSEKDATSVTSPVSSISPHSEGGLKCVLSKKYDSRNEIRYVIRSLSSADSDESPLFLSAREENEHDSVVPPVSKVKPDSQEHANDACYVTREQALLTCSALVDGAISPDTNSQDLKQKDNVRSVIPKVKRLKPTRKRIKSRERKTRPNLSVSQKKFRRPQKRKHLIPSNLKQFNTRSKVRSQMLKSNPSSERHSPYVSGPLKARLKNATASFEANSDVSSDLSDLGEGTHATKQQVKKKKRDRPVTRKRPEKTRHAFKEVGPDETTAGDDLPEILPPKRRRVPKIQNVECDEIEFGSRLSQEFPKHNWLEIKIKQFDQLAVDEHKENLKESTNQGDHKPGNAVAAPIVKDYVSTSDASSAQITVDISNDNACSTVSSEVASQGGSTEMSGSSNFVASGIRTCSFGQNSSSSKEEDLDTDVRCLSHACSVTQKSFTQEGTLSQVSTSRLSTTIQDPTNPKDSPIPYSSPVQNDSLNKPETCNGENMDRPVQEKTTSPEMKVCEHVVNELKKKEEQIEKQNPEVLHALREKPAIVKARSVQDLEGSPSVSGVKPNIDIRSLNGEVNIRAALEGMIETRLREDIKKTHTDTPSDVSLTLFSSEDTAEDDGLRENVVGGTQCEKLENYWRLGTGNFTSRGQPQRNVKHTTPVQRVQPQVKNPQDTTEGPAKSQAESEAKDNILQVRLADETVANPTKHIESGENRERVPSYPSTSAPQVPAQIPCVVTHQPVVQQRLPLPNVVQYSTAVARKLAPETLAHDARPFALPNQESTSMPLRPVMTPGSATAMPPVKSVTLATQQEPLPAFQPPPHSNLSTASPNIRQKLPPGVRHMTPDAFMREYRKMKREYQRIEVMLSLKEREIRQLNLMKDRMSVLIQKMAAKLQGLPIRCAGPQLNSAASPGVSTLNVIDRKPSECGPPPAHAQEPFTQTLPKSSHPKSAHMHKSSTVPRHLIFMDKRAKSVPFKPDLVSGDDKPLSAHSRTRNIAQDLAATSIKPEGVSQCSSWKSGPGSRQINDNNIDPATRLPSQESEKSKPIEIIDLTSDGPSYQKGSSGNESGIPVALASTAPPAVVSRASESNDVREQRVQEMLLDAHVKRGTQERKETPPKAGLPHPNPYEGNQHEALSGASPHVSTRGPPALVPISGDNPINPSTAHSAIARPGEPHRSPTFPGRPMQSPSQSYDEVNKGVQNPARYNPPYANHSVGDSSRVANQTERVHETPPNKGMSQSQAQSHYFYAQVKTMQENARKNYNQRQSVCSTLPRSTAPAHIQPSPYITQPTSNGQYQTTVPNMRDRPSAFYPGHTADHTVPHPPMHGPIVSQPNVRDPTRRPSFPGSTVHTIDPQTLNSSVAAQGMRKRGPDQRYPVEKRSFGVQGAPGQYYRTQSPMVATDTRAPNSMHSPRGMYPDQRQDINFPQCPTDAVHGMPPRAQMAPPIRGPVPMASYGEPTPYCRPDMNPQQRIMQTSMGMHPLQQTSPRMPLRPPTSSMPIPPQMQQMNQYPMQMPSMMQIDGRNGRDLPTVYPADRLCVVCHQRAAFLCSGCKRMWYCSERCQTKSWQHNHKHECPAAMM